MNVLERDISITEEDIKQAHVRILSEEQRIKKAFLYVKQLSFKKFKNFMNSTNSDAYQLSSRQWNEAMESVLQPKQIKLVKEKFDVIQKQYDGIDTITVKFEEFDLFDLMQVVDKEMRRAAGIHGDAFKDYAEAKEAIDEEIAEIWDAAEKGDLDHAKVEAIQAIGVLIKFMRTVHEGPKGFESTAIPEPKEG